MPAAKALTSMRLATARRIAVCLFLLCFAQAARADDFRVLDAYTRFADTPFVNSAADYIAWLKQQPRFRNGGLDGLPDRAIVLYNVGARQMLNRLGYADAEIEELSIGHTDPNQLLVVRPKVGRPFIVNIGLPGAGGISTQAAELGALGVRQVVHIGTAGLLGPALPYGALIVATSAYKDGAAFLLSASTREAAEQIATGDTTLGDRLERQLDSAGIAHARSIGFTSPVYYFQKTGLVRALLTFPFDPGKAPGFVEMEQASLFATARLAGLSAASIVVGSDRAMPDGSGTRQEFYDGDLDILALQALRQAIAVLTSAP